MQKKFTKQSSQVQKARIVGNMFVFLCRKTKTKQKASRTKKQMQTRKASNVIFKGQIAILKHLLKILNINNGLSLFICCKVRQPDMMDELSTHN